jgi:hypothetical protein
MRPSLESASLKHFKEGQRTLDLNYPTRGFLPSLKGCCSGAVKNGVNSGAKSRKILLQNSGMRQISFQQVHFRSYITQRLCDPCGGRQTATAPRQD